MHYPSTKCQKCGERLYKHVEGGYQCLNCESRYAASDLEFDDDGGRVLAVPSP